MPRSAVELDPKLGLRPAQIETPEEVVVLVDDAVLADRWRDVDGPENLDVARL